MDLTVWIILVAAVLVTAATVAWFLTNRQHPEEASGHLDDDASSGGRVARRPAGPAAESMAADRAGGRTPVQRSDGELGPDSGRHGAP